jgi:methanogenic corrinoid protein MtbC1
MRSGEDQSHPTRRAAGSNAGHLSAVDSDWSEGWLGADRGRSTKNGAGVFDIYAQVFQESLYEVGGLWAEGKISVSVEHRATAITQFVMAGIYSHALPVRPSAPPRQAIVTGVAGEMHQIGANMVADVLENAGWNVEFLGTDAPMPASSTR